jgi:hypothetical protein
MRTILSIPVILIILAAPVAAQPTIGVYFDEAGTRLQTQLEIGAIGQAYVLVEQADMLLAGAAFRLEVAGDAVMAGVQFAPGIAFGDLESGLEIGLFQWVPQFGDDPFAIATFSFFAPHRTLARWTVVSHPRYATPVVASHDALQHVATGLLSLAEIRARPRIGVFFDEGCTQALLPLCPAGQEIVAAWLCVRDAETLVTGAAFRLQIDAPVTLLAAQPQAGLVLGDLLGGVEFGLYHPIPVFDETTALLFRPVFIVPEAPGQRELRIVAHPAYETPVAADNDALILTAEGVTSVFDVRPCGADEPMTWGQVKTLY